MMAAARSAKRASDPRGANDGGPSAASAGTRRTGAGDFVGALPAEAMCEIRRGDEDADPEREDREEAHSTAQRQLVDRAYGGDGVPCSLTRRQELRALREELRRVRSAEACSAGSAARIALARGFVRSPP